MKNRYPVLIVLLFGAALYAVTFHDYLSGDKILLSSDALIRQSNLSFAEMVHRIPPNWKNAPLLGAPRGGGTSIANISKGFFSTGILWNNWMYGLACLTASSVLAILFLRKKMGLAAALCGGMTAMWLGPNFSIIYAGHLHKPFIVLFFICSLFPAAKAASGSVFHGLIWGGCVGMMFTQQPDVAMFFALFAGFYLLFQLWKAQGFKPAGWLKILLPAAAIALLFAVGPLLSGYKHHVKGAVQMTDDGSRAKWDYITQWSWPPEDSIEFIAPGYAGWGTGRPEGPYWGRCGRSAGWEETGQGFKNFKLDAYYLGMIPVGFALFALYTSRRSKYRAEILFWGGATLVALLLAFGKFFPLYALFFKLPVVNSIRSPVKFLQIFQICVAILSVYGMNAWLFGRQKTGETGGVEDRTFRRFFWFLVTLTVLFALSALVQIAGKTGLETTLVGEGWAPEQAEMIMANKTRALWHAAFMTLLLTGSFAVFGFARFAKARAFGSWIAAALVLAVAVDAYKLSRHYVQEMPRSYIEANALTRFLKNDLRQQRVAFLSQQGIDNIWITYLMPYNRIPSFNFTDMPRMATDYQRLLSVGQRDPLNMWRFSSVKYLLGSSQAEQQLAQMNCKKVFAYGLSDAGDREFKVVPHAQGPFAVYELSGSIPRYALFAGSGRGSDEQALAAMADFSRVILSEETTLPVLEGRGQTGSVEVISYRSGKVKLRIRTEVPAILRAADRYDPDWKAALDGRRVDIDRVDFLCMGVAIPPGEHTVTLHYSPGRLYLYLQLAGLGVMIVTLAVLFFRRKGTDASD